MRRLVVVLAVLVAVLASAGCSNLTGTEGKSYISGEGRIDQIPVAERGEPVTAEGVDLDGAALDLADYRGKVVVLNTFASWCPPCRQEMPTVVGMAADADPAQVAYLGVSIRDDDARARSFASSFGIDFPSFADPSSEVLLRLSDKLGPWSLPSTVVLDRQGRVAAIVLGQIPGAVTFREVVDDVVAET